LKSTADDLGAAGWDSKYGWGLVDADEAAEVETPPPSVGTMYIESILMDLETVTHGPNEFTNAIAIVTIVDLGGNPVEGATVSGSWSEATTDTDSGITDGIGQVSLESDKVKNPSSGTTFTFTVDDVTKEGWTYDSTKNVETSDSITVP